MHSLQWYKQEAKTRHSADSPCPIFPMEQALAEGHVDQHRQGSHLAV